MTTTPGAATAAPAQPAPTTTPPPAVTPPGQMLINSPTLVMADSKVGKSSLLATAAEYVWETFGLVSRLYLTDGGGMPTQMQSLQRLGIVQIWRMRTRSADTLALETCQRASMGYWPARINPRTGEVPPNVALVAPITTRFTVTCPADGTVVGVFESQAKIPALMTCAKCKVQVTKTTGHIARTAERTKGFENVGAHLFDGLSSMSSWMMDDMAARSGRNELGGEAGAIKAVASGELIFGGNNRASYGFVQQRLQQMVNHSQAIPGQVIPAVWTALVKDTSENGLKIKGPNLAGNAATADAPSWFGNCVEATIEVIDNKNWRVLHLQPYIDRDGYRHLCGVRAYPGYMPSVLKDEDLGEETKAPFANFSLKYLHVLLDQARQRSEAEAAAKYANAPGLPPDDLEYLSYGETSAPATVAVVKPAAPVVGGGAKPPQVVGGPKPAGASAPPVTAPTPAKPAAVPRPTPAVPVAPAAPVAVTSASAPASAPVAAPAPAPAAPVTTTATGTAIPASTLPKTPIKPPVAPRGPVKAGAVAPQPPRPATPSVATATPAATMPPAPKPPQAGPMAAPPGTRK